MRSSPPLRKAAAALAALLLAPAALAAQRPDSAAPADPQYRAGGLHRFLLGSEYRDLWTAPVRVEVLDPTTFAGGLRAVARGGGNQTLSLELRGADGREYRFRSVPKFFKRTLDRDLEGTLVAELLQDQGSSLLPGVPVALGPIHAAAGVLYAPARLYRMPDHPFLGEFREFAGMLGTLEERPDEGATGVPGLGGAAAIESAEDFLAALDSGATDRVDNHDFLTGRLVDLLLNDWDRHEDQYRWARFDRGGERVWRAVPRDRDYVFVDYDGFLLGLARSRLPKALRFQRSYKGQLEGLTQNAVFMDRRFLAELPREVWDSTAAWLRARITDEVIGRTVRSLPPEYTALRGERLAATLRARRDGIPGVAREFYLQLAGEPEVYGKDLDDFAVVERSDDGSVEVRLYAGREARGEPYFARRFWPAETREVRVWLRGGSDRAEVRGAAGPILVRVLGGPGNDALADLARGGRTVLYDHEGNNGIGTGRGTVVDTRAYDAPVYVPGRGAVPPRDWGSAFSWFSPALVWKLHAGPAIGAGPSYTRWGFRRHPLAATHAAAVLYAPFYDRFGIEYNGLVRKTGSDTRTLLTGRLSDLEATGFFGYGNDTPDDGGLHRQRVWERQALAEVGLVVPVASGVEVALGPTLRWTDPEVRQGTAADVFRPLGTEEFTAAGLHGGVRVERTDTSAFPRRGFRVDARAAALSLVSGGDGEVFGNAAAVASTYLGAGRRGPVLALRGGAEAALGEFPFQYAAYLGGQENLRGYDRDRWAGDAALFGSVELRQVITRAELIVNGDLGAFALADAGRVYVDGESPGGWHTALGGGLFFRSLGRTVSAGYAYGERGTFYFWLGAPF
ncbi:MAG TPA: BamA/TamA family outer membrane protein [Longimicrobiaceae bacterium]|nr:BamA/TamA family outer membrane protein [Longimicrobiaceae bacterium]